MLKKLKEHLLRLHRDERGAMSAEMILIVGIIALPIIILLAIFRKTIIGWFTTQESTLEQNAP